MKCKCKFEATECAECQKEYVLVPVKTWGWVMEFFRTVRGADVIWVIPETRKRIKKLVGRVK